MNLLISACLMGVKCRYDGKTKPLPCLKQLMDEYTLIPVCPEVLGGLPTPRVPAERIGDKVITQDGRDVTRNYEQGAQEALRMAQMTGCTTALLRERSPSCGSGVIYDGSFSGGLCPGDGVCGALLKQNGIHVLGESRVHELLPFMVRKAGEQDAQTITRLALKLWPDNDSEELLDEIRTLLHTPDAALFLLIAAGETVGFAQCQLRHDYVEGTDGSPVGYLEGVYVDESHRRKGGARRLLSACEDWARERGCTEFASDCELDNTESLAFHLHAGFSEANRIICFTKKL